MTPTSEIQERIRRHLLGQLSDGVREELEQELLTNEELFEELLVIEDELVDQYLSGNLNPEDRTKFETHFLVTPERREKLKFGRAFDRYLSSNPSAVAARESTSPVSPWRWIQTLYSSPARVAVFAILIVVVALGVWRISFHQSGVDKALVALNAAYREHRPLEARISQFDYAPYITTRGSGTDKVNETELRLAELTLLDALNQKPTPAVHHALGKVYLAKKEFDKAIEQFDEAIKTDSKNAQLFADLGAAWLEKGKLDVERGKSEPANSHAGKGIEELGRALENVNKALELNSNLLEALFNRALCEEQLTLDSQAENDWRDYLKKDGNSPWADEVRRRLQFLEEQRNKKAQTKDELFRSFLAARESGDDEQAWELLGKVRDDLSGTNIAQQLSAAVLNSAANGNDVEVQNNADALKYLGDLEKRKADDHYNANLALLYGTFNKQRRARITIARAFLTSGYEHYRNSDSKAAVADMANARQAFEEAGDHEESCLARYWLAYCRLEVGQTHAAITILQALADDCQARKYQWLRMRTVASLASANFGLNEYSKALNDARHSLELASLIQDSNGKLNALDALIEINRSLNNRPEALKYIEQSLPLIECCSFNPIKVWRHFAIIASALDSGGLFAAAIAFQKQALNLALALEETSMICVSYAHLGIMYGARKDYEAGISAAKLAYETAAQSNDEDTRNEMMAYSSLQTGNLYRDAGRFELGLQSFDRAIELYDRLQLPILRYQAHKGRLACLIAKNDVASASKEIATTMELVDQYRATILEPDNRDRFFDAQQTVYDLATDFAYSRENDSERAFDYIERSRARTLLALMAASSSSEAQGNQLLSNSAGVVKELPLAKIKRVLPEAVQIVEYAVLNNKVLIGLLTSHGLRMEQSPIGQADLAAKVRQYVGEMSRPPQGDDRERERLGKELYDVLLSPVESRLDRNKQLVIVADKALNALPFNALRSPQSGRYLVQDYTLLYAPSTAVFIKATAAAENRSLASTETLLSVGNPKFDPDEFSLADLPEAAREAKEVASLYKSARYLTGSDAVKSVVEQQMRDADVVHLAVHAMMDGDFGLNSKLIFASDRPRADPNKDNSALPVSEIYRLNLTRPRLIILSACATGLGPLYAGEGTESLARAFLVSGVPLVISSLWPVDSSSTAELMLDFHRQRRDSARSSPAALRQAQLNMLTSSDGRYGDPYYWACFVPIGGYTKY